MTRPADFGFDAEAQILRDTARRLLHEQCANEALHRLVAASSAPARARESVWDRALWRRIVELGWTAVAVPERAGGFGMGLAAIAGLAEEVGRAALPSPLISTLCATYVLRACGSAGAEALLRRIAAGTSVSLAVTDRRGSWDAAHTDVVATDGVLEGTAYFVQDAAKAAVFVVRARTATGVGLYVVEADAPGVTIVPDAIVDLVSTGSTLTISANSGHTLNGEAYAGAGGASSHCRLSGRAPQRARSRARLERSASRISGLSKAGSARVCCSSHRRQHTPGCVRPARPWR